LYNSTCYLYWRALKRQCWQWLDGMMAMLRDNGTSDRIPIFLYISD
jgi:hypothetical protein